MFYQVAFLLGGPLLALTVGKKCTIENKIADFNFCNLTRIPLVDSDTQIMWLDFNYITELNATSFPLLENTGVIYFRSQQHHILTIYKNSFRNVPNLLELRLDDNTLLILDPEAFAGLSRLQNLFLCCNGLNGSILENDYFKDLTSLEILNLSINKITYLRPNPLFYHLFYLGILLLSSNQISSICEGDLHSFQRKYFSILDLSYNGLYTRDFSDWEQCGNPFRNIDFDTLILSGNYMGTDRIQKLNNALNGTKIFQLQLVFHGMGTDFGYNNMKDPDNSTFAGLVNSDLQILDLTSGSIFSLYPYTFGNLTKLQLLNLQNNKINSIKKYAFYGLNSLRVLNMSYNLLGEIYSYTFDGLPNISKIDLRNNNIGPIMNDAFSNLRNLKDLNLQNNAIKTIRFFDSISFIDYIFLEDNKLVKLDTNQVRTSFINLENNKLKNLGQLYQLLTFELLNFVILKNNILSECFLFHNISKNNSLLYLDLSENAIDLIWSRLLCLDVFNRLSKLQVLQLNDNYLTFLPDGIFNGLTSLNKLNLSNNLLTSISPGTFPMNLNTVDLSRNKLLSPSPEVFASLKVLDITHNQYICECNLISLIEWVNQTNITLLGSRNDIYCMSPGYLLFHPFNILLLDGCDEELVLRPLRYSLFIVTTLTLVIFMTSVTVYTHFRGLFFALCKKITMSVLDEKLQRTNADPCKYDAYLCYSSKDFDWVQEAFLKNLDSQYCDKNLFHLCFEERDFIPGEEHVMNIRNAIWNSKKTICIVTKQFLKNGWCVEAFNYAQSRYFSDLKDVLIMIVVGSISEYQLKRYKPIRMFVQRRPYLKWPEDYQDIDWFLSRLSRQILKEETIKTKDANLANQPCAIQLQNIPTVS